VAAVAASAVCAELPALVCCSCSAAADSTTEHRPSADRITPRSLRQRRDLCSLATDERRKALWVLVGTAASATRHRPVVEPRAGNSPAVTTSTCFRWRAGKRRHSFTTATDRQLPTSSSTATMISEAFSRPHLHSYHRRRQVESRGCRRCVLLLVLQWSAIVAVTSAFPKRLPIGKQSYGPPTLVCITTCRPNRPNGLWKTCQPEIILQNYFSCCFTEIYNSWTKFKSHLLGGR